MCWVNTLVEPAPRSRIERAPASQSFPSATPGWSPPQPRTGGKHPSGSLRQRSALPTFAPCSLLPQNHWRCGGKVLLRIRSVPALLLFTAHDGRVKAAALETLINKTFEIATTQGLCRNSVWLTY